MQQNFEKKKIVLLILGGVAFIAVIIAIAAVSFFANNQHPTTIVNQEAATENGVALDSESFTTIGEDLHTLAEDTHEVAPEAKLTAAIREASYTETVNADGYRRIGFLLDVDDIQTTYYVTATVDPSGEVFYLNFGCTSPEISKYPSTFCVGTDNISSIDTTLSDKLPYSEYQNGSLVYNLEHYGGATYLSLRVYTPCGDQPTHDAAVAAAQAWVKEQVPNIEIPIQEEDFENTCSYGIDGES